MTTAPFRFEPDLVINTGSSDLALDDFGKPTSGKALISRGHKYYEVDANLSRMAEGAVFVGEGIYWMGQLKPSPFQEGSPLTERLSDAVATAARNGFPVDAGALNRGLSFAMWLSLAKPEFLPATDVNVGPAGSFEFLISLPKAVIEVTAERAEPGFDVWMERREGGGPTKELHCSDAVKVVQFLASAAAS